MDDTYVVLGVSGALGSAVAHVLNERGLKVRGVSRSGVADVPPGVELVTADITDALAMEGVLQDAKVVFNCVNLPYHHWKDKFVPLTEKFISVMEGRGIPVVVADNLYMYPEDSGEPLHEDMPYGAQTVKGRVRARVAELYLQAHREGRVSVVLARGPDFFGPRATATSFYGDLVFGNVLEGKTVDVIGDPSMPHQIIYVMDFARAMVMLGEDPSAYGQAWHCPSAPAVSQREFVEMVYRAAGRSPRVRSLNRFILWFVGLFNPVVREIREMYYEFTKPYLVSHEKFMARYDFEVTPLEVGISETLDWFRSR